MVIFQYNLYIFGIHLWTVLYPKPCYNKSCYKEVEVWTVGQGETSAKEIDIGVPKQSGMHTGRLIRGKVWITFLFSHSMAHFTFTMGQVSRCLMIQQEKIYERGKNVLEQTLYSLFNHLNQFNSVMCPFIADPV